jgi:magnesium transporter
MDLHLSSVNLRMNEVMKILTIMASLFIPPTFVASVYGMNFDSMPELRAAAGYPIALGIMLALIVSMLAFFRRRGWIGREIDDGGPGVDAA